MRAAAKMQEELQSRSDYATAMADLRRGPGARLASMREPEALLLLACSCSASSPSLTSPPLEPTPLGDARRTSEERSHAHTSTHGVHSTRYLGIRPFSAGALTSAVIEPSATAYEVAQVRPMSAGPMARVGGGFRPLFD